MLLVDDNRDLLHFLERLMADAGWTLLTAESATEAKRLVQAHKPNAALLDYMLPDGNGVELGVEFLQAVPQMLVIVMTGTILPPEEEALCEEHNFPVLRKPFLASDVMNQIRSRLTPPASPAARSAGGGRPLRGRGSGCVGRPHSRAKASRRNRTCIEEAGDFANSAPILPTRSSST